MRNKKRNKIFLLLILLLGISVGFAALATTLKINGSATITKNTWNIYWDNIANEDGVTPETETIIESEDANHPNNIVTFEVEFDKPGDYYEFTVDAVNAGTLDAEILSIEKKYNNTLIPAVEDPEHRVVPAYLKYEVTYADTGAPAVGDKLLKAVDLTSTPPVYTTKTYKIRVEYDRDAVTNSDINNQVGNVTHEFSFKVEYGQATPSSSPWVLPQGKNANNLEVGDELCIKDQCFNFVRYDEHGDAVLLAKYNLNVDGYNGPYGGTATNIQNSEVRGEWNDGGTMKDYGRVGFSYNYYWYEWDGAAGIKPKYNADNYPVNVYDPDYMEQPENSMYSIAYYVEPYKDILEGSEYGTTIKKIRLLTYEEAVDTLGCSFDVSNGYGPCPTTGATAFVSNTDYWLGSARTATMVYRVLFNRMVDGMYYDNHGVRPVIVIEKSNLE